MPKQELNMEQFKELITGIVQAQLKELGLTDVDKKFRMFPTSDELMGRKNMTPEKALEVANFFRGLLMPEAQYNELRSETGQSFGAFWRALEVKTPEAGGYLVPTEFRAEVIMAMEKSPILRNLVTIFPVSAKEEIPRLTAKPQGAWGTENTDISEGTATFDNITLSVNQLSIFLPMSRKLAANARINIVQLLTQLFAENFGLLEDAAFMNGNGTGKPLGLRQTPGITEVAQSGAALTGDDLIDLYHALPSQYRRNAVWLMNDLVIAKVRKLKEAVTGQYLWVPGLAGAPATILGRPVYEQQDIPTNLGTSSPANESEIWFGDPKYYYVGDNETMAIESTTVGGEAFRKHQLHMKAWEELDGKLALTAAWRYMSGVK